MEEINISNDYEAYKKLTLNEQKYIKYVLAYFASSDIIVMDNISINFINEVQYSECKLFYSIQLFMESVH